MLIVGGTYQETTREPGTDRVFGSGLRAAAAVSSVARPRLITCIDQELKISAEVAASVFGIDLTLHSRAKPIRFDYHTPLSPPLVDGENQLPVDLTVIQSQEPTLVYGMLESNPEIDAPSIVYDPQKPRGAMLLNRNKLRSEKFGLVANVTEILSLAEGHARVSGQHIPHDVSSWPSICRCVQQITQDHSIDVVVVKRGALGAAVFERGKEPQLIPAYETISVWPIGSGDIFSAVFAWAWMEDKQSPAAAAHLASAATAVWCETQSLPINLAPNATPEQITNRNPVPTVLEPVLVYLAGPFFDTGSRWLIDLCRGALNHIGATVFSPMHDVGMGGDEVAVADLDGLDRCNAVMGLLDGADAGTLFEMGYAVARKKPTVGFAEDPQLENYKMLRGTNSIVTKDLSTAVYRTIWEALKHRHTSGKP